MPYLVALIVIAVIAVAAMVMSISILIGLFRTKVPFVSSSRKHFHTAMEAVGLKPGETVFDLGCGKAHLLIHAAKNFGAKGVGYEMALWPYLWAKFNIWISRADVTVHMSDFYKADISKADVVYCYLFPEVMDRLAPKFARELKPGARVASYGFKISHVEPAKTVVTNQKTPEMGKIRIYNFDGA